MAKYWENDCAGCDHCVHCGNDKSYLAFNCDICGEYIEAEDVHSEDGIDYCPECWGRKEDDLK